MSKDNSKSNLSLWAIDPFDEKATPDVSGLKDFMQTTKVLEADIQPLFVASSKDSEDLKEKAREAQGKMRTFLEKSDFKNALPSKILISSGVLIDSKIEALIQYADETNAKMIIASSRKANDFSKLVFGSFTEKLLAHANRPLYFLAHKPDERNDKVENRVIFATDFSRRSEFIYDYFLKQMMASNPEIILYYAISLPLLAADGLMGVPESFFSKQEEDSLAEAQKWILKAEALGMKVTYISQNVGVSLRIARSIIDFAKQKSATFIAMASNSGKLEHIFFGSVAREVFDSHIPIWICGPKVGFSIEQKEDKSTWSFYDHLQNG